MARPVVGVFTNRNSAEQAILDLKQAGLDSDRMGLLMQNREEGKQVASETGVNAGKGAVTGGVLGGALGAILAATGAFVIPGIGPFISAGILATAITGGAVGAIAGGLVGLGIPKDEAEYYENQVRAGNILVTVDPQGHESEARAIMLRNGAEDTWRSAPWSTGREREDVSLGGAP
jgi:hypothetical protein